MVRARSRAWLPLAHAAAAAAVTLTISYLLQGWSLGEVWALLAAHFGGVVPKEIFPHELIEPWSWRWLSAMARFAATNFPWPLLLLALPGLALLHARRSIAARPLLLAFIWGTYLLLTLMANKMERYLQPVYPLLCLLTAWWVLTALPRRWRTVAALWMAVVFGAVLVLAHHRPLPWSPRAAERYSYELHMPSPSDLSGLRRRGLHPRCDVRRLVDAVAHLVRRDTTRRPLAIHVPDEVRDRLGARTPEVVHAIHHGAARRITDRLLVGFNESLDHPMLQQAPTLVVIGSARLEGHPRREVGRATAVVPCEGGTHRLHVRLVVRVE